MVLSTQELARIHSAMHSARFTEMFAVTGTYLPAGGAALMGAEFQCARAEKNHTPIPADGYNGYSCTDIPAFGSY